VDFDLEKALKDFKPFDDTEKENVRRTIEFLKSAK
jgi:hypothetical protein